MVVVEQVHLSDPEEISLNDIAELFKRTDSLAYVRIDVQPALLSDFLSTLGVMFRRYYVSDGELDTRLAERGIPKMDLVLAKIPDRPQIASGDFGEILTAIFQAVDALPLTALDPMKWRYKEDRNRPAPHSDVVQFITPHWPESSSQDRIVCSEVKTKSTPGSFSPIRKAIEDSGKDKRQRLVRTLLWLREKALQFDLNAVSLAHLDRFIQTDLHPQAETDFRAVVVICTSLVDSEINGSEIPGDLDCTLYILTVPDLARGMSRVFLSLTQSVQEG